MRVLVARDLKVRYRQTLLGVAWAVVTPVMTMGVFSVLFGGLVGIETPGLPYPLFSLTGLLAWRLLQSTILQAGSSLVRSRALVNRVYCPRLAVPIAAILPPLVDFVFAGAALVALLVYYGHPVGLSLLALPAVILLILLLGLGVGLFVSALAVRFHDTEHLVSFGLQILLFVSPIIYPTERVIEFLARHDLPAWPYGLNPVTGAVELFRWAVLGGSLPPPVVIATSIGSGIVLLGCGLLFFKWQENVFADYI